MHVLIFHLSCENRISLPPPIFLNNALREQFYFRTFFFFILAILKFNFHFVQWWKIILFEMYTANEIIVSRYIKFSNLIISSVIFDIYFEYFSTWKSLSRYFSIDKKFKRTSIASTWTKISMKVMYEYFVLH